MGISGRLGLLGRTSRTTFVTWVVGLAVAQAALTFAFLGSVPALSPRSFGQLDRHPIVLAFEVAATIVLLVLQARRFHDQDRPGWIALTSIALWVAGVIVPSLGGLGLIVVLAYVAALFLPPTVGPNRFGPDPRGWRSPEHRAEQDEQLRQSK
jgi:uncharacterized membrane protein YhaH (DUF805 family)